MRTAFQTPASCGANNLRIEVVDCLNVLAPSHQRLIRMLYLEGYTPQEAADTLNIPKTTVNWYKREALAAMRRRKSGR